MSTSISSPGIPSLSVILKIACYLLVLELTTHLPSLLLVPLCRLSPLAAGALTFHSGPQFHCGTPSFGLNELCHSVFPASLFSCGSEGHLDVPHSPVDTVLPWPGLCMSWQATIYTDRHLYHPAQAAVIFSVAQ